MNFFAHALLAAEHNAHPAYVLGSMLPDFCTMAGVKSEKTGHTLVDAGIAHHHLVDDVFHPAPGFVNWMGEARDALEDAGVDLGPAMAVGHVGVELILDGWLAQADQGRPPYREALQHAARESIELGSTSDRLHRLVGRLVDAPFPEGYVDADFVAERLRLILAPRPRLALDEPAFEQVRIWARHAQSEVGERGPELMAQVRTRLEARMAFAD